MPGTSKEPTTNSLCAYGKKNMAFLERLTNETQSVWRVWNRRGLIAVAPAPASVFVVVLARAGALGGAANIREHALHSGNLPAVARTAGVCGEVSLRAYLALVPGD